VLQTSGYPDYLTHRELFMLDITAHVFAGVDLPEDFSHCRETADTRSCPYGLLKTVDVVAFSARGGHRATRLLKVAHHLDLVRQWAKREELRLVAVAQCIAGFETALAVSVRRDPSSAIAQCKDQVLSIARNAMGASVGGGNEDSWAWWKEALKGFLGEDPLKRTHASLKDYTDSQERLLDNQRRADPQCTPEAPGMLVLSRLLARRDRDYNVDKHLPAAETAFNDMTTLAKASSMQTSHAIETLKKLYSNLTLLLTDLLEELSSLSRPGASFCHAMEVRRRSNEDSSPPVGPLSLEDALGEYHVDRDEHLLHRTRAQKDEGYGESSDSASGGGPT
jgi:hypothetical protein